MYNILYYLYYFFSIRNNYLHLFRIENNVLYLIAITLLIYFAWF